MADAAVMVLEPIVLAGQFNDSLLGEGGTAALVGALHKMTLAGVPVVLTWGDFWERRGLITDFTPSPLNEDLVDWQLTFKPHTLEDPIVTRPQIGVGGGIGGQVFAAGER